MEDQEKQCNECGELKPITDFPKSGKDRQGNVKYRYECKNCYNKRYGTNWKYRIMASVYTRFKESAYKETLGEKIGAEFLESLKQKQGGKCYWLGIEMDFTRRNRLLAPSLDRLDPSMGYERDNVVLTTMFANLGRGESSESEMRDFLTMVMGINL